MTSLEISASLVVGYVTPLVLSAYELYRRRQEAKAGPAGDALSGEGLRARLRELEDSALEQARLIDELSRTVESLARTVDAVLEENNRKAAQIRRLLFVGAGVAVTSLALSSWSLLR